jgi:hypothetical protein
MTPFRLMLIVAVGSTAALAQSNPFSDDARQSYALVKDSLLKAADRMPAADYSFLAIPCMLR